MAEAAVEAPSIAPNGHTNGFAGPSTMPDWPGELALTIPDGIVERVSKFMLTTDT